VSKILLDYTSHLTHPRRNHSNRFLIIWRGELQTETHPRHPRSRNRHHDQTSSLPKVCAPCVYCLSVPTTDVTKDKQASNSPLRVGYKAASTITDRCTITSVRLLSLRDPKLGYTASPIASLVASFQSCVFFVKGFLMRRVGFLGFL